MAKDDKDDDLGGKIAEKVGWLTGDREAEAKGKLRRLHGKDSDDGDQSDEAEAEAVKEAEKDVRAGYGEYDPDVDGAPTASDVRPAD